MGSKSSGTWKIAPLSILVNLNKLQRLYLRELSRYDETKEVKEQLSSAYFHILLRTECQCSIASPLPKISNEQQISFWKLCRKVSGPQEESYAKNIAMFKRRQTLERMVKFFYIFFIVSHNTILHQFLMYCSMNHCLHITTSAHCKIMCPP